MKNKEGKTSEWKRETGAAWEMVASGLNNKVAAGHRWMLGD